MPENFGALTAIVLSEILFGFFAGVLLQISFAILSYAGEVISFIMGFIVFLNVFFVGFFAAAFSILAKISEK